MKQGDVVVLPMPTAGGSTKPRPAIVLREMPPFRDVLLCGVSTQLHQVVKGFDEVFVNRRGLCVKRSACGIVNQARVSSSRAAPAYWRIDWLDLACTA